MNRVAIIQPWIAQYRKEFFDGLRVELARDDIQLDIFYGAADPALAARGDAVIGTGYIALPTHSVQFGSKSVNFKGLKPLRRHGPYDLIVVEQAVRNLETYALLLHRHGAKLAWWGHGRTYTQPATRGLESLKQWLTRRGSWFFAYTAGGAQSVAQHGFPTNRISVLNNAIDTKRLATDVDSVTDLEVTEFVQRWNLRGKTALFIGGLDAPKRLKFLLAAAERAHSADPDVRVLIAGDGVERGEVVKAAVRSPAVQYVGSLRGHDKAVALASAQILAMPGRVGLVAVDSFAAGRPILTTDWPWHAPEFEYLRDGETAVVTADDVDLYADEMAALLRDPIRIAHLQDACRSEREHYTVDAMIQNFAEGVRRAIQKPVLKRGKITIWDPNKPNPYGREVAALLSESAWTVSTLTSHTIPAAELMGIPRNDLRSVERDGQPAALYALRRLVEPARAAARAMLTGRALLVIWSRGSYESVLFALTARVVPVIVVHHNPTPDRRLAGFKARAFDALLEASTGIIVHAASLREALPLRQQLKTAVCPHPLYTHWVAAHRAWRMPAQKDRVRLLVLGALRQDKGISEVPHLVSRLDPERYSLLIVGSGKVPDELVNLCSAKGFELTARVESTPVSDDMVADALRNSDVLIAPYVGATMSGTICLAASAGLQIVAYDRGGLSEFLSDAALVSECTPAAMAARIEGLKSGEPSMRTASDQYVRTTGAAWVSAMDSLVGHR